MKDVEQQLGDYIKRNSYKSVPGNSFAPAWMARFMRVLCTIEISSEVVSFCSPLPSMNVPVRIYENVDSMEKPGFPFNGTHSGEVFSEVQ